MLIVNLSINNMFVIPAKAGIPHDLYVSGSLLSKV
jgi:hypothetical protein